MDKKVTLIIGAVIGSGAGWFVGSVVADYIDEKELRDQIPPDLNEDEEQTDDDDEESSGAKNKMPKKRQQKKKEKVNYSQYFNSIDRPDLAALAKKYNEGIDENAEPAGSVSLIADDEVIATIPTPVDTGISIISSDQFNNNEDDFEVVELSYYADEIMVGEDDNIIPDPEDIIGDDALVSFGMLSGDPDIVYVRNSKVRALYEIVRMSVKYAIDADADEIIPRKGLKKGIDFDEVNNDENDEEVDS